MGCHCILDGRSCGACRILQITRDRFGGYHAGHCGLKNGCRFGKFSGDRACHGCCDLDTDGRGVPVTVGRTIGPVVIKWEVCLLAIGASTICAAATVGAVRVNMMLVGRARQAAGLVTALNAAPSSTAIETTIIYRVA